MSEMARIRHYLAMRAERPLVGLSDDIHCIHTGTEWQATLSLIDLKAAVNCHDELVKVLEDARLQIEYLDSKFTSTGTSASTLARIRAALQKAAS